MILKALAGGRAQTLAGLVLSLHCALDDLTDHRSLLERINHERAVASNGTNAAATAALNAKRRMPLDAAVVKRILDQLVREATFTVLPGGVGEGKSGIASACYALSVDLPPELAANHQPLNARKPWRALSAAEDTVTSIGGKGRGAHGTTPNFAGLNKITQLGTPLN